MDRVSIDTSLCNWLQIKTILHNSNIVSNCLYQLLKLWNCHFYLNTLHYSLNNIISLYDTVRRQVSVLEQDKACTATLTYDYSKRREFYRTINYTIEYLVRLSQYETLYSTNPPWNINQRTSFFFSIAFFERHSYSLTL